MFKPTLLTAAASVFALATAACSQQSTTGDLATVAHSGKYGDLTETPDLSPYATKSGLAPVAVSGDFNDLINPPDLSVYAPVAGLSKAAFSGKYTDLTDTPSLAPYATKDGLAPVAVSGDFNDLINSPDLSVYAPIAGLSRAAFSGKYTDLIDTPDLTPYATTASLAVYATNDSLTAYAKTDSLTAYAKTDTLTAYAKADSLAAVARSGSYTDLANQPWIGDATQIGTNSRVTIDTTAGTDPLAVLAHDTISVSDQSSGDDQTLYSASNSDWQSFTAGVSGQLTRIDVNRWWSSPDTGYTLNIYQGEGTGGTLLSSQSGVSLGSGVSAVQLSPTVTLVSGQVYTWELTNATGFRLVGYNWATYGGGRGNGNPAPGMDYQFATYVQPSAPIFALSVDTKGNVGVGTNAPTAGLDVTGNVRLRASSSPASTDACQKGQMSWDENYVYICVATNTWKRSALGTY